MAAARATPGRWPRAGRHAPPGRGPERPAGSRAPRRRRIPGRWPGCPRRRRAGDPGAAGRRPQLVRMGLRVLVDREDDMRVVGEAEQRAGRPSPSCARSPPDVLLLDIRMPGMDGLELLRRLTADPDLPGCAGHRGTTFEIDEYVFEALRAGASGFILKDTAATRTRARGPGGGRRARRCCRPSVTRRWWPRSPGALGAAHGRRRPRHADRPGTGDRRLGGHRPLQRRDRRRAGAVPGHRPHPRGRAMAKLNARSRAQLVVLAVRAGLTVQ